MAILEAPFRCNDCGKIYYYKTPISCEQCGGIVFTFAPPEKWISITLDEAKAIGRLLAKEYLSKEEPEALSALEKIFRFAKENE